MKNTIAKYLLLFILCNGNKIFAQTDLQKAYMDSLDQMYFKEVRLRRTNLNKEDSMTIKNMHRQVTSLLANQNKLIDSLMSVVRDKETPMVLAEKITDEILSIDSRYSIEVLLKNFNLTKYDEREASPWNQTQYPCLNTLLYSNRLLEIYDCILNTDFIENYSIYKMSFGQSSTTLLTALFRRYSASRELIKDVLHYNHSEKYYQILNSVLEELE